MNLGINRRAGYWVALLLTCTFAACEPVQMIGDLDESFWWDWDGDGLSNNTELVLLNITLRGLDANDFDLDPSRAYGKAQRPGGPGPSDPHYLEEAGTLHEGLNFEDTYGTIGYYYYRGTGAADADDWGTGALISTLERSGRAWFDLSHDCHAEAPAPASIAFGIGDMSRQDGGNWDPDHRSHQNGRDVDMRPLRKDGLTGEDATLDLSVSTSNYDRGATEDLLWCIWLENPLVDTIFLNKSLFSVVELPGSVLINANDHYNHFHTRINDPDGYTN